MPIYPTLALLAAGAVVALELLVLRTGVFTSIAYWITMAISLAFMIPVDGWLTKLTAPIVIYRDGDVSGIRPIWDILVEEYAYAFALLTLVIMLWERAGRAARGGRVNAAIVAAGRCRLVRRDGGRQLRRPPLGDARPGHRLARQPPPRRRWPPGSATTCSRCCSR